MNWQEKVDSILDQLRQVDESALIELEGCSEEEIHQIEQQFGYKLPAAYTAFLRRAGRYCGELMEGSFPRVLMYRKMADSLLADEAPVFRLDDRDHVFYMHQGSHFFFFRVGLSEDPEVSLYNADEYTVRVTFDSFTDWLDICIKDEIDLRLPGPRSYS